MKFSFPGISPVPVGDLLDVERHCCTYIPSSVKLEPPKWAYSVIFRNLVTDFQQFTEYSRRAISGAQEQSRFLRFSVTNRLNHMSNLNSSQTWQGYTKFYQNKTKWNHTSYKASYIFERNPRSSFSHKQNETTSSLHPTARFVVLYNTMKLY